MALPDISGR